MKSFEGKNYYEILGLPFDAGLAEVKQAYTQALEIYDDDALATYALFSDAHRKNLLQVIDDAFHTLANEDKRLAYNQMLIATGQVESSEVPRQVRNPLCISLEAPSESKAGNLPERVRQKSMEEKASQLKDAILSKGLVSGEDLKALREALGVDIAEIFEATRISKTTIERMEQNQYGDLPAEIFLKSFLKAYAEILKVDPQHIVSGYLKHMALSE